MSTLIYVAPYQGVVPVVGDPYWSSVKLLMWGDGVEGGTTFIDQTGKAVTRIRSAVITTTQSKFGGSSINIPALNAGGLSVASSTDWSFGTGNFTVEFWVRPVQFFGTGFNSYFMAFSGFSVYYNPNTNTTRCQLYGIGDFLGSGTPTMNQWNHIAIVRNGNIFTFYMNGTGNILTTSALALPNSAAPFYVTCYDAGNPTNYAPYAQYDDIRVTKGIARYTTNFTPPTAQFPNFGA